MLLARSQYLENLRVVLTLSPRLTAHPALPLGSGLIDQSQKRTAAAMQIAEK
jgi:hypothetical protein